MHFYCKLYHNANTQPDSAGILDPSSTDQTPTDEASPSIINQTLRRMLRSRYVLNANKLEIAFEFFYTFKYFEFRQILKFYILLIAKLNYELIYVYLLKFTDL